MPNDHQRPRGQTRKMFLEIAVTHEQGEKGVFDSGKPKADFTSNKGWVLTKQIL